MLKASAVDRAFRSISMRGIFSKGVRGKGYSRPATYWPSAQKQSSSTNYGEPMDINAVVFNKKGVTCYNCQEKGHFACDCPKPKRQNAGPSNRGNQRQNHNGNNKGTGKAPQKKPQFKNANQFKTHVRTLAIENCKEMEESEKEKFLAELEGNVEDF